MEWRHATENSLLCRLCWSINFSLASSSSGQNVSTQVSEVREYWDKILWDVLFRCTTSNFMQETHKSTENNQSFHGSFNEPSAGHKAGASFPVHCMCVCVCVCVCDGAKALYASEGCFSLHARKDKDLKQCVWQSTRLIALKNQTHVHFFFFLMLPLKPYLHSAALSAGPVSIYESRHLLAGRHKACWGLWGLQSVKGLF